MNLQIVQVSKCYPNGVFGVRDLSCQITPGVLGVLGPNGAGKSTLLQILATTMQPTQGRVLWQGTDVHKTPQNIRKVLGYLPQEFGLLGHLNALEFLRYIALLKGMDPKTTFDAISHLLDVFNLSDVKKKKLATFSGGMKQRIGIAQALLNNPDVLLLDEPTTGLDPHERIRFRNIIEQLSAERIVILSSHIVSEIESLADRVAIIFGGRLVACRTVQGLLDVVKTRVWETVIPAKELETFQFEYATTTVSRTARGLQVRFLADQPPQSDLQSVSPTLEDAYMYFINLQKRGIRQ